MLLMDDKTDSNTQVSDNASPWQYIVSWLSGLLQLLVVESEVLLVGS